MTASKYAAGKKHLIRVRIDQGLSHVSTSLQQGYQTFGESGITEQSLDPHAAFWSEIAGFADHGIARSYGRDDLADRNRKGIIPGTNDGQNAERLIEKRSRF